MCLFRLQSAGESAQWKDFKATASRGGQTRFPLSSSAIANPQLIRDAADKFGSQCVVCAIDAKRRAQEDGRVYLNGGRIDTGRDAVEWAVEAERVVRVRFC